MTALAALVGGAWIAPARLALAGTVLDDNARNVLAAQILNGMVPEPPDVIDHYHAALTMEFGAEILDRLIGEIVARNAASIDQPFTDAQVEKAARRLTEMFYTGEVPGAEGKPDVRFFHQALAWQVLGFTKPPSICGPGFGWWAAKPPGAF